MTPAHAEPAVSIVMPTLNQARFITEALDSVLAGGLAGGWAGVDLVVADGGSSDGTQAVLAAWSDAHPGLLRWQSHPDGGPAAAINAAVARARGEVIGWLNSDDLYTPGAIARALAHLQQHPQQVMVYGEGEHIDTQGRVLGPYPTRGPDLPLQAWADGCPICQPTAFFRREAFLAVGGLFSMLRTAFDYEFWLRLAKAYPSGLGRLHEVQAQSRLHEAGITLRMREDVALEALQVIHHHIGPAPAHWLLTHFHELMAGMPFDGSDDPPAVRLMRLVEQARPWLAADAVAQLRQFIINHRVLRLARAHWFADAHGDGWAGHQLDIRLRQGDPPWRLLRLHGRHAAPGGQPLRLQAERGGVPPLPLQVARPGPFSWELPLQDLPTGAQATWRISCAQPFVPAQAEPGSTDTRELAFLLEGVDFIR